LLHTVPPAARLPLTPPPRTANDAPCNDDVVVPPSKKVICAAQASHGATMPELHGSEVQGAPPLPAAAISAHVQRLVAEYMDFVWRSLRRLGVAEADCDDGCQRVWVILARKVGSIQPEKTRSFVFSVVVRVSSEMRRASARHQLLELDELSLEPAGMDAERLLEQKRHRELLDQVLASLSWELRTVFVMFELEGLSSPEIADALGIRRGTVASRLRLARAAFQRGAQQAQRRALGPQHTLIRFVGAPTKAVSG
jgi:RNA polymerase sigma-70 factor (ECF subfamily)